MKLFVLLVVSLFSTASVAQIEEPSAISVDSFVPGICTLAGADQNSIELVAATGVCIGKIGDQQAIKIDINDNTSRVYIVNIDHLAHKMGRSRADINGYRLGDANETITGVYIRTSGIDVSHQISVSTSSNLEYSGNARDSRE